MKSDTPRMPNITKKSAATMRMLLTFPKEAHMACTTMRSSTKRLMSLREWVLLNLVYGVSLWWVGGNQEAAAG